MLNGREIPGLELQRREAVDILVKVVRSVSCGDCVPEIAFGCSGVRLAASIEARRIGG